MGRCIAKLADDEYVEWSTVVDAPVTWIMGRAAVTEYMAHSEPGVVIEARLDRCDERGHSALWPSAGGSVEDLISGNRAGPGETELTLDQLRERYQEPKQDTPPYQGVAE